MPTAGLLCAISKTSDDAGSFANATREAHRARREFLRGSEINILSHEHFASPESDNQCMDLYEVDDIEGIEGGTVLLEQGGDGGLGVEYYVYRVLSAHGVTASHSSEKPGQLVMVSLNPPASHLDELNKWYEEEHIPLLRKVPGWESTIRGKAVFFAGEADKTLPPYVGFHRYAKENGNGTSQEWKASMSSEWATKMLGVIKSEGSMARSQWNFEETH